ncbi:Palmitoyl-protein thioesterase 1 [Binucleata daphniae]
MKIEKLIEMKEKGNTLYKNNDMQEAMAEYNNAIDFAMNWLQEIKVNSAETGGVIATAQIEPGRVELNLNTESNNATKDTTNILKIEIAKIYYNIAVIFYEERMYTKCIEYCENAAKYHNIEQINTKLFLAYTKCGMYYKALDIYKNITKKTNEITKIINSYKENEIAKFCESFDCIKTNDFGECVIDQSFFCDFIDNVCKKEIVPAKNVFLVLKIAYNLFCELNNVEFIDTTKKVYVFGDTHGQFFDTLQAIKDVSGDDFLSSNGYKLNTENVFVFNGDFVDRGEYSVENMTLLLLLKILYPQNIYLNRGNHEFKQINAEFGFFAELTKKYDLYADNLFSCCQNVFACFPIATTINKSVFVVHGGLPEKELEIEEIMSLNRKLHLNGDKVLECLMWSDPDEIVGTAPSKRRAGVLFGKDITERFLKQNNLSLLVRSHEYIEGGVKYNHNKKCVTIFSAPNYCGMVGPAAYLCFHINGDEKVNDSLYYSIGKITANINHT